MFFLLVLVLVLDEGEEEEATALVEEEFSDFQLNSVSMTFA